MKINTGKNGKLRARFHIQNIPDKSQDSYLNMSLNEKQHGKEWEVKS